MIVVLLPIAGSEEDEEGDTEVDGGGPTPSLPNQPGKPTQRPVRLRSKRHKTLANKPQDFQVLYTILKITNKISSCKVVNAGL